MNKIKAILLSFLFMTAFGENVLQWNADKYHVSAKRQNTIALNVLEDLEIPQDASILDVGCGDGKITNEIAKRVPYGKVVGTDISHSMIELAQKTYNPTHLSFRHEDVTNLFINNSFDYVTSFFCLHWVQDKKTALQNMTGALKEKGTLVILATIDDDQPILQAYEYAMRLPKWKKFFETYEIPIYMVNCQECTNILIDLGCTITSCKKVKKFNLFNSDMHLKKHLEALPLSLDQLEPVLHDDFLFDVIKAYKTLYPENKDKTINYLCPYVVLMAKK